MSVDLASLSGLKASLTNIIFPKNEISLEPMDENSSDVYEKAILIG